MATKMIAESLGQYVKRIMKEKQISLNDVEAMSGKKITDAYVGSIIKGKAKNLTVDKLQALARGLGVDEDEIFRIARRITEKRAAEHQATDPWHSMAILKLMEKVVMYPDLKEVLEDLISLSPQDRAVVLKSIKSLVQSKSKSQGRRESS